MRSRTGLALTVWLLTATACFGQNDMATVLGTVTDASGALVPQAKLRLDNLQTGVAVSAVSDANGLYQFLDVRIGQYRTEGSALTVAARQRVDIALQVGDAATTVTVNDATAIAWRFSTPSARARCRRARFSWL